MINVFNLVFYSHINIAQQPHKIHTMDKPHWFLQKLSNVWCELL